MAKIAKLRVQVAPVGYEIDRIVLPAIQEKADRVWLLIHENKSEDKAGPFITKIEDQLKKAKIEVIYEDHNRLDLFKIIRAVRNIIDKEDGNEIYVNLSSGSKIQAIGTMMACMMFNNGANVHPFYVEAEQYLGFEGKKPLSTGIKEIQDFPPYSIRIPEQRLINALKIISEAGGKIRKKDMAERAEESKMISVNPKDEEHRSMVRLTSLEKNIVRPLEEWGFVEIEKIGRTRWIKFTREGQNASEFLT